MRVPMAPIRALGRSPLLASVVVTTLVFLGVIGLRHHGYLETLELVAYDWFIRVRPKIAGPNARLALIVVTENDIQEQGRWPLSDETLARVLTQLVPYRPRAIGLDIYRDLEIPPGHDAIEAVFTAHRHIIAPMKFGSGTGVDIPPPPVLARLGRQDQIGFVDMLVDPGGIVRRGLLFLDHGTTTAYALALRLALLYLQAENVFPQPDPVNPQSLRLGPTTIRRFTPNDGGYIAADAGGYQFLLDFREAPDAFPSFPLSALLAGKIAPEALRDKIVLLGVTAESVKDDFYTPYSRGHHAKQQMAGVVLHAHIASQLLRSALDGSTPIRVVRDVYEWLWIALWSAMGGLLGLWIRSPWRFAWIIASGLCVLGLVTYTAFVGGWWLPVAPPALTWVLAVMVVTAYVLRREIQEHATLMQLFGRYVAPEVADAIWQQRDQVVHQGRPRSQIMTVSVLFTDLVGFTPVSEKMEPRALVDWLNDYMEAMTPHVIDRGGVILRYIGDAIMAVFGVPLARSTEAAYRRDAVHAVQCALAMAAELCQLNRRWHEQGLPMIGMRVGIYTGSVVAGSTGSAQRLEYNVHGDTVNTAARLESFEKQHFVPDFIHNPCRILIGEATFCYLDDRFQTRRVGAVQLKGKTEHVTVYRVFTHQDSEADSVVQEESE